MPFDHNLSAFFKILTFFILVFLIITSSWSVNWHYTSEIVVLVLFLCAYTILLTLPITKFKLSPTGFEGELERLVRDREGSPSSPETVAEVDEEIAEFSQEFGEPDTVLMRLAIEIEVTLRTIAESSGFTRLKVGTGQLTRMLQKSETITDPWLIKSLLFFTDYRNALIHEGKTTDIKDGIILGREVLAKLRQIQKERSIIGQA